jgi:hypothetical protein
MPTQSNETCLLADDQEPKQELKQRTSPLLEILLDWLLNRWSNSTVSLRDIYRHGPGPLRNDKKTTLSLTETLVRQGWLIPLKTWRQDKLMWKIARGQLSS